MHRWAAPPVKIPAVLPTSFLSTGYANVITFSLVPRVVPPVLVKLFFLPVAVTGTLDEQNKFPFHAFHEITVRKHGLFNCNLVIFISTKKFKLMLQTVWLMVQHPWLIPRCRDILPAIRTNFHLMTHQRSIIRLKAEMLRKDHHLHIFELRIIQPVFRILILAEKT